MTPMDHDGVKLHVNIFMLVTFSSMSHLSLVNIWLAECLILAFKMCDCPRMQDCPCLWQRKIYPQCCDLYLEQVAQTIYNRLGITLFDDVGAFLCPCNETASLVFGTPRFPENKKTRHPLCCCPTPPSVLLPLIALLFICKLRMSCAISLDSHHDFPNDGSLWMNI